MSIFFQNFLFVSYQAFYKIVCIVIFNQTFMEYIEKIQSLFSELDSVIVGQETMKRDILIALLSGGHILLEWAPGLAKTLTVKTFSDAVSLWFQRIQFTPDLLPSDLIGAKIYNPESKTFDVRKGPLFANIILADEINRAPSKVQSALLEAMEEKQVTIGDESYKLDTPFMVLATQNPIEQEGTYHLPEAQLDRFLLKTVLDYPTSDQEISILKGQKSRKNTKIEKVLSKKDIADIQKHIEEIHVSESIYSYIKDIVFATRENKDIAKWVAYGVSPRASLALLSCSQVLAYISGRDFVTPEDIKEMAFPVLRHRFVLSYEALAEDVTPDSIIEHILEHTSLD